MIISCTRTLQDNLILHDQLLKPIVMWDPGNLLVAVLSEERWSLG